MLAHNKHEMPKSGQSENVNLVQALAHWLIIKFQSRISCLTAIIVKPITIIDIFRLDLQF
jgi:hypothetical protein